MIFLFNNIQQKKQKKSRSAEPEDRRTAENPPCRPGRRGGGDIRSRRGSGNGDATHCAGAFIRLQGSGSREKFESPTK